MKLTPAPARVGARRFLACIASLFVGAFAASAAHANVHLKISANKGAIEAFSNWTEGVPWQSIQNYKNRNASRPVVDLLLQLQALKAGGLDFDFELVRVLTYELAKQEVIQGRADLTAETIWDNEISTLGDAVLSTPAVIRDGDFVKGVYVLPSNEALLKISSLGDLSQTKAAVVGSWALDVKAVENMKLAGVVKTATPELAFAQVQRKQADFILVEFSSAPDMSVDVGGVRLVPAPNCKVTIAGSRAWIVAKTSPHAAAVHQALVAGTKILRENGTIERAYRESGFFDPRVTDWKKLL